MPANWKNWGRINDVPMPFLIDTGATRTVIPARLAEEAGLVAGRLVRTHTAGGDIAEQETHINTLKIGNAFINNLNAGINEHLEEVLIGMNTLKHFNITQSGNTMTLVANGSSVQEIAQLPIVIAPKRTASVTPSAIQDTVASNQPIKKPVTIKKTVTCDTRGICRTKYSDR